MVRKEKNRFVSCSNVNYIHRSEDKKSNDFLTHFLSSPMKSNERGGGLFDILNTINYLGDILGCGIGKPSFFK